MKIPSFVSNVRVAPLENASWFSFYKLHFTREGSDRSWELLGGQRKQVSMLLFDEKSQSFVLRRKFRPSLLTRQGQLVPDERDSPEGTTLPTTECICTELFSSFTDCITKTGPILNKIKDELLCEIDCDKLEKVTSFTMWGGRSQLYYVPINANNLSSPSLFLLNSCEIDDFLLQESAPISGDLCLALQWWKLYRSKSC